MRNSKVLRGTPELNIKSYLLDGKPVQRDRAIRAPHIVAGSFGMDDETAYAFSTEESLLAFAATFPEGRKIAESLGVIKMVNLTAKESDAGLRERQIMRLEHVRAELASVQRSKKILDEVDGAIAATFEYSAVEGPVIDPILLFANHPPSGAMLPLGSGIYPFFNWINFNNKASAAIMVGFTTLFDDAFFGGARCYLISNVRFYVQLELLGFDNRANGAFVL